MDTYALAQLDQRLDSILQRVQSLRQCALAGEADRRKALDESQCLLGALALYRRGLENALTNPGERLRHAA